MAGAAHRDRWRSGGASAGWRRQKEQLPPAEASAFTPYLMLLVRPDGVVSYYRFREALHSLKIDFGYEFIDADWVLDFPADDADARRAPWMTAAKPPGAAPSGAAGHARLALARRTYWRSGSRRAGTIRPTGRPARQAPARRPFAAVGTGNAGGRASVRHGPEEHRPRAVARRRLAARRDQAVRPAHGSDGGSHGIAVRRR